jgi:hypothetical protein
MAMSQIHVGWSKTPTHDESDSGEKSHPHPHPRVKFQIQTHQVCKWVNPIKHMLLKCAKWSSGHTYKICHKSCLNFENQNEAKAKEMKQFSATRRNRSEAQLTEANDGLLD